jgi:hypothetical protein
MLGMLWCRVLCGLLLLGWSLLLRRWWSRHCAGGKTVVHGEIAIPVC